MSSTSRETGRDALVVLLEAALVGTGKPVKTVTGSKPTQLVGMTPLVAVLSAGTLREVLSFQGNQATFWLDVLVYVQQAEGSWTNAMAEDALDTIERLIEETYEANAVTDEWAVLGRDGRSTVFDVSVEGNPYYVERIPSMIIMAKS